MLVDTIGCLACHRVDKRGSQALFGGGNLSAVANKRPADFFARWLAEQIPNASMLIQAGAAHFAAIEVMPDVLSWLIRTPD